MDLSHRMPRALVAAAFVCGLLPLPASASDPSGGKAGDSRPQVRDDRMWDSDSSAMALWFWPETGRAYQLTPDARGVWTGLRALDTSTLTPVDSTTLDPPAWGEANEFNAASGRHHVGAIDRESGRLFFAYGTNALHGTMHGPPCPTVVGGMAGPECVSGIHVLDARSLDSLARIPLTLPTVEGPRAVVIPRALEYAPPDPELGWDGRVLMVVEEVGTGPTESSLVPTLAAPSQNAVPRRNSGNLAYAVAFDPDTGRQDWVVRLEGCRNAREPRSWMRAQEGHPTAVYRTGGTDPAVVVACHGNPAQQGVVVRVPLDPDGFPAALPLEIDTQSALADGSGDESGDESGDGDPAGPQLVRSAPRQEVFVGPDKVTAVLADPTSGRVLMRVDDAGEVWWVFDERARQFIGTIGIGDYNHGHTTYGLDGDIGRLYVLAAKPSETHLRAPGGLYLADIRRNPLSQALHYVDLADPPRTAIGLASGGGGTDVGRAMSVMPRASSGMTRIFQTEHRTSVGAVARFRVLVDESPASVDAPGRTGTVERTLDVPEEEGVTGATFDGTARGFGFRAIAIGGVEGAARVGPADPTGTVRGLSELETGRTSNFSVGGVTVNGDDVGETARGVLPAPDPCADAQRELIVAFVGPRGPAVVDASSARGEAQPILVDVRTREDVEHPTTRCAPMDWAGLWDAALVSRPPTAEPGLAWPFDDGASSCTATDEETAESWSDPVVGVFSSRVECGQNEVAGWGQARGVDLDGVSVADTLSSFRIYRDPARGIVARVESIARGIDLGGVVKIDTIRGVAESWANGRAASSATDVAAEDADAFNPFNCDRQRPAGTCFQRQVFGVTVIDPRGGAAYRCGPCGPEDEVIDVMNRAFSAYGYARFREPDPELARGSDDGFIAAITKKDKERFADIVLNNDLLETIVPMLEVVRYAPHNRPSSQNTPAYSFGTPPRGRQVYQFAGVEASSSYGIQCLLVYDAQATTCGPPPEQLGSLSVQLTDGDGAPLAGGAFEVRRDVDGDGIVGLVDELLADGACVTGEDGTGTCAFEALQPGSYLVSQTAAPPGYASVTEPWVSQVGAGEARTVTFTNTTDVSTIEMTATDGDGNPVEGATFAVFPDRDADGKVAPDATPVATCTTDASGLCAMDVPAGSYVLVQTVATAGMEPIEPVAFAFASGGQTAAVGVVNQPAAAAGQPASPVAASPIAYAPPVRSAPRESVAGYTPPAAVAEPRVSVSEQVGGTVVRVVRAPGDALRLLSRDPKQAVAWIASLILFALATLAVRRRQLLGTLTATPALASTAGHARPPGGHDGGGGAARARGGHGPVGGASRNRPPAGPTVMAATALLDRPAVAGGAPAPTERLDVTVVVATASPVLAALATSRLAVADRLTLLAVVDSWDGLRATLGQSRSPDVVVVDLDLSDRGRRDVAAAVAALHPPDRVIALIPGDAATADAAADCVDAGLAGLLAVDGDLSNGNLAFTIRQIAAGKPCYGPTVQAALRYPDLVRSAGRRRGRPRITQLTDREREIAELTADGVSRVDIAEQLCLSPWTVKRHLQTIRAKLGVVNPRDRDELRRRLDATTPAGDG